LGKYRVAVDVGGTNTDVFIFDELSGDIQIAKVPSVPMNPALAIINGMEKAGIPLSEVTLFSHGTTVGTNALITRNLPLTGMVNTKGFRDVIEIRRAIKEDLWDVYKDGPLPHVRRRDRLEVEERIDAEGKVIKPLDEDEARKVARLLKKKDVKAVAVCFINSYINGAHEARMKEILLEELPSDTFICTSSEILPEIFEHERFSTTVANAVLGPVVGKYLRELVTRLSDKGYKGEVLVLHSGGGVMTAETIVDFAARVASSGIAAGAIACSHIAQLCGYQNAIGLDMGGTSTDISLMYEGHIRVTKEWQIEFGYPIVFPSIEVLTIGAGGGSIAWVDEGGSLRNGPQSAGAVPGPACYMKGGTEPTNTDANLVLGRLGTSLLAGAMTIDKDAAEKAVSKIADQFNFSTTKAASAIAQVANANMCDAVRLVSVRRGYDPREFVLVAFGGGGSVHSAYLAQELEIPTVIVPRYPGVTSAMGCLLVDVRHDVVKTYHMDVTKASAEELEKEYVELEKQGRKLLEDNGVPPEDMEFLRYVDMRYVGQWRSLTVPVNRPVESLKDTLQTFHTEHQREYAWSSEDQGVQIYVLQVAAIGRVPKPDLPKYPKGGNAEQALIGTRQVYFEETGFVEAKVYQREKLPAGATLQGPAIIEQLDTTTVVPPFVKSVEVDEYLNIIMQIGKGEK